MAHHYEAVPLTVSISLAAALAGVSRVTFCKLYLRTGRCHVTTALDDTFHGVGVNKVWTWELEAALGRSFTVAEVQAAECALDKGRSYQRHYRRKHA